MAGLWLVIVGCIVIGGPILWFVVGKKRGLFNCADTAFDREFDRITAASIEDLTPEVTELIGERAAKRDPGAARSEEVEALVRRLPQRVRRFFEQYDSLVLDEEARVLDVKCLHEVEAEPGPLCEIGTILEAAQDSYLVRLDVEESPVFYAMSAGPPGVDLDSLEEYLPSFEHYVALEGALWRDDSEDAEDDG